MSKIIWQSDPPAQREVQKERAFVVWMGAVECLRPELFTTIETVNASLDEINELYAAFELWWKEQINQCPYIIVTDNGYLCCILEREHLGDHCPSSGSTGYERLGESWILPEQLAWRQRRSTLR